MHPTVSVTGASGFLGSHVVATLLERGFHVIALVRDPASHAARQLRALPSPSGAKLEIEEGDVLRPASLHPAIARSEYVIHTAAAVAHDARAGTPSYRDVLDVTMIGAQNVLSGAQKAPSLKKLVFTSSMAAVLGRRPAAYRYSESDWNADSLGAADPYTYAKTWAEREFRRRFDEGKGLRGAKLVCINPTIIIGPARAPQHARTSLQIIDSLDRGKYPGCANLFFSLVDVRDVARVHVEAIAQPAVQGRFLMPGHSTSMLALSRLMKSLAADSKAPSRAIPDWLMYASALFSKDVSWRYLRRNLGVDFQIDDGRLQEHFPSCYRPLRETVLDSILALREVARVRAT